MELEAGRFAVAIADTNLGPMEGNKNDQEDYASNMWANAPITNSNRGAFEAGLQQDIFNAGRTPELTKDSITVSQLDYVSEGALALDPSGNSWDLVVVMGHGNSFMWGGPLMAFDGSQLGKWLKGWGGPRKLDILACNSGGTGTPFRKQAQEELPFTQISGQNGQRRLDPVMVNGVPRIQAWW